ncbi:MAG: shikimate dehydrogenase [Chloroflexi bacterium]|nr:shikimate dehydrogenase [Chloroflexota bacterium]
MRYQLGLIGYPAAHSLSPPMHRAALQALGLDGDYTALAVQPECLSATVRELPARDYRGINVTIPHKQAVIPLLDGLSASARAIGAVNTIVVEHGRLIGHNTDAVGFGCALARVGYEPRGQAALVLGAGGAARAVVYALTQAGAHVTVWNRTRERAEQLARDFGATAATRLLPLARCGQFSLIVNTTPVGMAPDEGGLPLPMQGRGFGAQVVYDLVYRPRETALLREARAVGAMPIGGLEMLVYQGAEAFRLWTGRDAPVEVMRDAAISHGG